MSMYECINCGSDDHAFPKVFLFINTFNDINNTHNSLIENKYRELNVKDTEEAFENILYYVGKESEWLCSIDCAIEYLNKKPRANDFVLNKFCTERCKKETECKTITTLLCRDIYYSYYKEFTYCTNCGIVLERKEFKVKH